MSGIPGLNEGRTAEVHRFSLGSRRLGLRGAPSFGLQLLATCGVNLGPGHPSGETEAGRAAPPSAPEPSLSLSAQGKCHGTTILKYSPAVVLGLSARRQVAQKPRRLQPPAEQAKRSARPCVQRGHGQGAETGRGLRRPPFLKRLPGLGPLSGRGACQSLRALANHGTPRLVATSSFWSTGGQMAPGRRVQPQ